jgi:predicted enzyme related to lactoylglutathione lyase
MLGIPSNTTDGSASGPVGRIGEIVIDVTDLKQCGQFWAKVLGVRVRSENERYLVLEPQTGSAPALILQRVPEKKLGKNRAHIDLRVKDIAEALHQVQRLGGRKVREVVDPEEQFMVVADPDGNEFCLVKEDPSS